METMIERIEKLALDAGVQPRKVRRTLAEICGVSYQAVASWFTGPNNPEMVNVEKIAAHYQVHREWIETGTGPKSRDEDSVRPVRAFSCPPQSTRHLTTPLVAILSTQTEKS